MVNYFAAVTPGLAVPSDIAFQSYVSSVDGAKPKASKKRRQEHLLFSSAHRNLDYTAKEEVPRGQAPLLNHYVGVYDPKTGKMQVIEAKKMTVRGAVRAKQVPETRNPEKAPYQVSPIRYRIGFFPC